MQLLIIELGGCQQPSRLGCMCRIFNEARNKGDFLFLNIEPDHLPKTKGPRAVFKPRGTQAGIAELLTRYGYCGGSHHLVLVPGDASEVLAYVSRFAGWSHEKL